MMKQMFATENPTVPLFGLAFRPFFLFGACFGSFAVLIWALTLNGSVSLPLYGGAIFWHIHEMLFGFTSAIIVGFLLTAVQTWTGVQSVNGRYLFVLFFCWLAARISFVSGDTLPEIWMVAVDMAFLWLAAFFLSIPLIKANQTRNLFFVPVLVLLSICNGMMHGGLLTQDHDLIVRGTRTALITIAILMLVIGGRIIPMFTANGTGTRKVANIILLDRIALTSAWLVMLIYLMDWGGLLPQALFGGLLLFAGIVNLARCVRWRFWITFGNPLLWPLHLAYGFICLAFLLLGFDLIEKGQTSSVSWHVLTVGGIGLLVLAMISRVSLGHTGRALQAPRLMLPAFILIVSSALIRTFFPSIFPDSYMNAIYISAILWAIAYGIFVISYCSMLVRPRVDNKQG